MDDELRRAALIWRVVLLGILILAGLAMMPAEEAVPSLAGAEVVLPTAGEGERLAALTFDDGPRRSTTTALLDGLQERGARATFFLIGAQVENNRDLIERMAAEGHQIGIHTLGHVTVTGMTREQFWEQTEGARRILYRILGERELWLRPPYGLIDSSARLWADSPIVLWSVDPEDWSDSNVDRIVDHVLRRAKDGDIILMHDIYPSSVEAALKIVDAMQAEGYRFVTVAELLQARDIIPQEGEVYRKAPAG